MELHLVRVQEMARVLQEMETGIEFRFALEEDEVKDADIDALLQHIVFLPLLDLFREHLGDIEQRAVSPDIQLRELDLRVDFHIIVHQYPHIQYPQLVVFMHLPQEGIQDSGLPDVGRIQVEHG